MATIRRKKSESFAILSSPGPWPQVLINWLATLAVIIVFGLIMLFSASYTTGYLRMGDSFYYIKSQVFCLGLGLAVMLLFSRIDHRFLRRMVGPGYAVCIVMLIAVLFSAPLNGCRRWLRIGFTIQVSEIAKFEMILLTAHIAAKAPRLEKLDPSRSGQVPVGPWLQQRLVRELLLPLLPFLPEPCILLPQAPQPSIQDLLYSGVEVRLVPAPDQRRKILLLPGVGSRIARPGRLIGHPLLCKPLHPLYPSHRDTSFPW